jgi:hypothetical protein
MPASWSAGSGAMCDTALFLDLSLHAILVQGTIDRRDGVAESITLSSRLLGCFNTFVLFGKRCVVITQKTQAESPGFRFQILG